MLPYITFIATLAALSISLYKDLKIENFERPLIRALGIHHLAQGALAALALWSAFDTEDALRAARIAQLDAKVATVATKHTAPILELYFFKLVPSSTVLANYFLYQKGITELPPQLEKKFNWNSVSSPEQRQERDAGLEAFKEIKKLLEP